MNKIQWDDKLSIGINLIDEQHKLLIQRLFELSQAVALARGPNEITKTLSFMIEYTNFHFSEEENHMKQNNYPGLDDQRKQHESFTTTLNNLEEDFREEGATHSLAESIDTFLIDWLVKHIQGTDQKFGAFLTDKGIHLTD